MTLSFSLPSRDDRNFIPIVILVALAYYYRLGFSFIGQNCSMFSHFNIAECNLEASKMMLDNIIFFGFCYFNGRKLILD